MKPKTQHVYKTTNDYLVIAESMEEALTIMSKYHKEQYGSEEPSFLQRLTGEEGAITRETVAL